MMAVAFWVMVMFSISLIYKQAKLISRHERVVGNLQSHLRAAQDQGYVKYGKEVERAPEHELLADERITDMQQRVEAAEKREKSLVALEREMKVLESGKGPSLEPTEPTKRRPPPGPSVTQPVHDAQRQRAEAARALQDAQKEVAQARQDARRYEERKRKEHPPLAYLHPSPGYKPTNKEMKHARETVKRHSEENRLTLEESDSVLRGQGFCLTSSKEPPVQDDHGAYCPNCKINPTTVGVVGSTKIMCAYCGAVIGQDFLRDDVVRL